MFGNVFKFFLKNLKNLEHFAFLQRLERTNIRGSEELFLMQKNDTFYPPKVDIPTFLHSMVGRSEKWSKSSFLKLNFILLINTNRRIIKKSRNKIE